MPYPAKLRTNLLCFVGGEELASQSGVDLLGPKVWETGPGKEANLLRCFPIVSFFSFD
jgi:hypothetical protein